MIYKNMSITARTFYGVTFEPGKEAEVPGYINHPQMLRLDKRTKEPPVDASKNKGVKKDAAPAPVVVPDEPEKIIQEEKLDG